MEPLIIASICAYLGGTPAAPPVASAPEIAASDFVVATWMKHPQMPAAKGSTDNGCLNDCFCEPLNHTPIEWSKRSQNIEEPNDSPALGPDGHRYKFGPRPREQN